MGKILNSWNIPFAKETYAHAFKRIEHFTGRAFQQHGLGDCSRP